MYLDVIEMGRFIFLSKNGNLVRYYFSYGQEVNFDSYYHIIFDDEWERIRLDSLHMYTIDYDLTKDYQHWIDENPDMVKAGVYFEKHIPVDGDAPDIRVRLSLNQFLEQFEEMAGFLFQNIQNPGWLERARALPCTR